MAKTDVYLDIHEKVFSEDKKEAIETGKGNLGKDWTDEMTFSDLFLVDPDWEFDEKKGKLFLYGNLENSDSKNFGYLSVDIKIDMEIALEVIEWYMKKLGKLKTVLEATK